MFDSEPHKRLNDNVGNYIKCTDTLLDIIHPCYDTKPLNDHIDRAEAARHDSMTTFDPFSEGWIKY